MLGLEGIRVDEPEQVGAAWEAALASTRPVVLEMIADADVPPLPPKVTTKQAKNYFSALLRRDPDAVEVVRQTAKEWWASIRR